MSICLNNLKDHFVAYIDILGFTNMVEHDFLKNPKNPKYITKLYDIHKLTQSLIQQESENIGFLQFSDSIVLNMEYNKFKFEYFINLLSKFQYNLILEGILCRGGIAYGKHFSDDNFMFSHGLIEAYKVENEVAVNPKIVISSDLFGLLYPYPDSVDYSNFHLLKDDDGTIFIDYLRNYLPADQSKILSAIQNESDNPRIISKQKWLTRYMNFKQITIPNQNMNIFETF